MSVKKQFTAFGTWKRIVNRQFYESEHSEPKTLKHNLERQYSGPVVWCLDMGLFRTLGVAVKIMGVGGGAWYYNGGTGTDVCISTPFEICATTNAVVPFSF